MSENVAELFDNAIKDYQAGASPAQLIPVFIDVCAKSPKLGSAWTCLSWLYLLEGEAKLAVKAAEKSCRIDPFDAQTRINLAVALLEAKIPGVRQHIEMAQQLVSAAPEVKEQVVENFRDGFARKPEWAMLKRVETMVFEAQ